MSAAPVRVVKNRPAETSGGIGATATVVAAALGASKTAVAIVGTAAGALPVVVTFYVSHGGLTGLWRLFLHGRR